MTTNSSAETRPSPMTLSAGATSPSLIIAVPFYRNEQLVEPFVRSLAACAKEIRDLNAQVVLFNDSPDYAPLAQALENAVRPIENDFAISVRRNATNMGWLKTCNVAMHEADNVGANILLFNSDTIIMPGAIREMVRVSKLDPMIGFVNPRSNNATLATLPVNAPPSQNLAECHERYRFVSQTFPDITYVPTAVGFAVLIGHTILSEFGYFDEAYGGGYNEENDLVMRASRLGYRAVLANHAFVWHQGEASLGATETSNKQLVELANRKILLARYPEYQQLVDWWFHGVEHTAEQLISTIVPRANGKLDVALDFSSFGPFHSGTHKAGLQLLQHSAPLQKKFNLFVLAAKSAYDFHEMGKFGVQWADPHGPEKFAALLRMGQPFDWDSMRRLSQKGAVTGVFMLDTIAIDCGHLYNPANVDRWQHTIDHADFIVYNSDFTAQQFENRFANVRKRASIVSLHSINPQDYTPAVVTTEQEAAASGEIKGLPPGYILVAGNQYPHKAVGDTASRIAKAHPDKQVIALGITKTKFTSQGVPKGTPATLGPQNAALADLPNLRGFRVGELTDAEMTILQDKAAVIVMPSHYEGFGLPVLSALAFKRPIVVRRLPPLLEINQQLGRDPNIHFFNSTSDLVKMLQNLPRWQERSPNARLAGDGERAADDIAEIMARCISKASYGRILERFRAIHALFGASSQLSPAHTNGVDFMAYRVGQFTERALRTVMKAPIIYGGLRLAYRAMNRVMGRNQG